MADYVDNESLSGALKQVLDSDIRIIIKNHPEVLRSMPHLITISKFLGTENSQSYLLHVTQMVADIGGAIYVLRETVDALERLIGVKQEEAPKVIIPKLVHPRTGKN